MDNSNKTNISERREDIFHDFVQKIKFYIDNIEISVYDLEDSILEEYVHLCDPEGNFYYENDNLTPILLSKEAVKKIIEIRKSTQKKEVEHE